MTRHHLFEYITIVRICILLMAGMMITNSTQAEDKIQTSPTEYAITSDFVKEKAMKRDLLQMLANNTLYASNIWYDCVEPNSNGEQCGFFKARSAGHSNEDGVRTNADYSMICAFLYKYAQDKVTLPANVTWDKVRDMAVKSLVFGYSTHKANRLKVTSNKAYWGSTAVKDHVWESSLWTMSLAYSAFFLDDILTDAQKECVYKMIKAECDYELERSIPTGYNGDTKAEENGWETNVLACALGLYPDDPLAPRWFERLRAFAINCYSHATDADDNTVIDPDYDNTTVKDLYKGNNLYEDYTLQNHNYFHTSYQNVVMQELGESWLALKLFQRGKEKWKTNALMHNNQKVMDEVLCRLALADGELAMPNGNDWSMFLYDQITSYSTAACLLRDANALMLENLAYKHIKARQMTTEDGSWLLNSDIGPRRMGVEAHRVMMTYLLHDMASTAKMKPTSWDDFCRQHQDAYVFKCQDIVRSLTPHRFSVFSWSKGLRSYTGYFAPCSPERTNIMVPYKAHNTGNIIGWYDIEGKKTNAQPAMDAVYKLKGNSYCMKGSIDTNEGTLNNSFLIYATPGNAIIYIDKVKAKEDVTVKGRRGGLMALSVDPFTRTSRTLYHQNGSKETDGKETYSFNSNWVNIDNYLGVVCADRDNMMAFGDRELSSSVNIAKLYTNYSSTPQHYAKGQTVDRRAIVYYSNVDTATTEQLATRIETIGNDKADDGCHGVMVTDTDGARYLLMTIGDSPKTKSEMIGLTTEDGAPVFDVDTKIARSASTASVKGNENGFVSMELRVFINGDLFSAIQTQGDARSAIVTNLANYDNTCTVTIIDNGKNLCRKITIPAQAKVRVWAEKGKIKQQMIKQQKTT